MVVRAGKGLACGSREPKVEVILPTVLGSVSTDNVARLDAAVLGKADSDIAAVVSATWTDTWVAEGTLWTEAGESPEVIGDVELGKVSARGTRALRVGAGAPSVLTTAGMSVDSFVVGR